MSELSAAIERWENTGGFSCSFPEDCITDLHTLAADYLRMRAAIVSRLASLKTYGGNQFAIGYLEEILNPKGGE